MQVSDHISALERRAATLNLTLWRVCKLAGVDYSNISRWQSGKSSPTVKKLESSVSAIDAKLTELEGEMLGALTARRGNDRSRLPA